MNSLNYLPQRAIKYLMLTLSVILIFCQLKLISPVNAAINNFGEYYVPIPGNPNSLIIDSQGLFAYIGNGSGVLVLDLFSRQLTQNYPFTINVDAVGDIDLDNGILSIHGWYVSGILDVTTGIQTSLIHPATNACISDSTIANRFLYAPAFNNRVIYATSLDGQIANIINPYPSGNLVAGPSSIASSPDGSKIIVGDEINNSLHIIQTSNNTVIATISIGFLPHYITFLDNDNVIVLNGFNWDAANDGSILVFNLSNINAAPTIIKLNSLENVTDLKVSSTGTQLFAVRAKEAGTAMFDGYKETVYKPEIIAIDLINKSVTQRFLIKGEKPSPAWDIERYKIAINPDNNLLLFAGSDCIYFVNLLEDIKTENALKLSSNGYMYCGDENKVKINMANLDLWIKLDSYNTMTFSLTNNFASGTTFDLNLVSYLSKLNNAVFSAHGAFENGLYISIQGNMKLDSLGTVKSISGNFSQYGILFQSCFSSTVFKGALPK